MCVLASVVPCLHQSLPKMGTAMSNQVGHLLFVLDFSRLDSPKLTCVGLTPRSALLLAQNCLCKPLLPSMTNFLWEFILQRFKFMVLLISWLLGTIDIICLLDLVLQTSWFYHEKIMKSWFFSLADVCRWWHLNFADFNRYFLDFYNFWFSGPLLILSWCQCLQHWLDLLKDQIQPWLHLSSTTQQLKIKSESATGHPT